MLFEQLLYSSLLIGIVLAKDYNQWTDDEKHNANVVIWICVVVGVLISISGIAAGGFFYMMRKRNSNNQNNAGNVMVVR